MFQHEEVGSSYKCLMLKINTWSVYLVIGIPNIDNLTEHVEHFSPMDNNVTTVVQDKNSQIKSQLKVRLKNAIIQTSKIKIPKWDQIYSQAEFYLSSLRLVCSLLIQDLNLDLILSVTNSGYVGPIWMQTLTQWWWKTIIHHLFLTFSFKKQKLMSI